MKSSSIAVLVSGGLDSAVLVGELARQYGRVYPLYIRQGLAWESVELYWLRRFLKAVQGPALEPLRVLALPMDDLYGRHWSVGAAHRPVPGARSDDRAVYLPGRNLVLLVKAGVFCALHKVSNIALGSLGHNPFPDASPGFFRLWAKTLQKGLRAKLVIRTPYRSLSKADVIRRGRGVPLELSFSCLAPVGKKHCGRCNKCAERRRAFLQTGVRDKTVYAKR
jgi:7-cyano-7-deazaguanine synthase